MSLRISAKAVKAPLKPERNEGLGDGGRREEKEGRKEKRCEVIHNRFVSPAHGNAVAVSSRAAASS